MSKIKVAPTGGALGAAINGCDLSTPLAPAQVAQVRQALLDYGVVFFRQQQLSDEDQVRFTAYFGKPVPHVRQQRPRRVKEIFLISNVKENGEPIGELGDELIPFHSDLSYLPRPGTPSPTSTAPRQLEIAKCIITQQTRLLRPTAQRHLIQPYIDPNCPSN